MTTRFAEHLLSDLVANRPAATAVPEGTLFMSTDEDIIYQSDGSAWASWMPTGPGAPGGSGGYDLLVDLSGATFSGWTGLSGTWASNGTIIQQTDGTIAVRRAKYNTPVPTASMVAQVDVRLPAGGTASGGLTLGWPGTDVTTYPYAVLVDDTADTVQGGSDAVSSPVNVATTVATNTWYTLTVRCAGGRFDVYQDSVFKGSFTHNNDNYLSHFIGLRAVGAADFRNLKVWVPTLPT